MKQTRFQITGLLTIMTPFKDNSIAWPLILTFLIIMVWMPFEGMFRFVLTVGIGLTALWAWVLHRRYKAQLLHRFSGPAALVGYWIVTGGLAGLAAPAVILGLMVLKTGIHSHGPEYLPQEIVWVWRQFWRWGGLGTIIGTGLGLLSSSISIKKE